ncbi:MAG: hypothetical protein RML56_08295 [Burkholderiales bacterium]|nr:hypothetical protein [Burkholderiales bacterium]
MRRTIAFALAAAFAAGAAAREVARPHPADPAAGAKPPARTSAFEDYRPYSEPELARWREANDEVRRLGGHAGHVPGSVPGRGAEPAARPAAQEGNGGRR